MPVNMMTDKVYRIDYDAWGREINEIRIFNNPAIQKIYTDKWMQILKELDKQVCKDYYDLNIRTAMLKEKAEAPENFQLPIYYETNNMYIQFRVSRILQLMKASGFSINDAINIDIKEFTDMHTDIKWTQTVDKVKIKTQPIIMAPLALDKYYKWIVIDGNHRITDAVAKGIKEIKAFCLDANSLVQENMFCTSFDKYLYIFQNESVALATLIQKEGYSEEEAFKLTYFYSGEVQWYS